MREIVKTKVSKPFVVVALVAALIISACSPKATHLSQNLENSRVPGQNSTQTGDVSTQTPGQGIASEQAPTSLTEPSATLVGPLATQGGSGTLPPVQTATSSPVILTPTATKKPATAQAATSTLAPTQTRTSTPTRTATLTPSPTFQTGWEGEWNFYLDNGSGGYITGMLKITLDGQEVFGEAVIDGSSYEFEGQLNTDGTSILGDYTTGTDEGWFYWVFLSDSQFGGMMDNRFAFCASRNGAERPGQCGYFILS